jgi:hypothetical protein
MHQLPSTLSSSVSSTARPHAEKSTFSWLRQHMHDRDAEPIALNAWHKSSESHGTWVQVQHCTTSTLEMNVPSWNCTNWKVSCSTCTGCYTLLHCQHDHVWQQKLELNIQQLWGELEVVKLMKGRGCRSEENYWRLATTDEKNGCHGTLGYAKSDCDHQRNDNNHRWTRRTSSAKINKYNESCI